MRLPHYELVLCYWASENHSQLILSELQLVINICDTAEEIIANIYHLSLCFYVCK